jgi:hypothetical protein
MGIEWFRDLSITILGFVTTGVLIFIAVLVYLLYRKLKSTLSLVKATAQIVHDTVALVKEGINPLVSILSLIQGIRGGFQGFSKIFNKESNEGEKSNEQG